MTHVVMGFSRYGKADKEKVDTFNHTFVRLVSLLHAVILAELEGDDLGTASKALEYELLDVQGLCSRTLTHIRRVSAVHRDHLPIMVFQWMHNLIVDNMTTEVLSIPAPLLTRVFRAMTESMLNYHEARKYADTPFPFPYTAGIEIVLSVHFILTPLFVALWTTSPFALCLFTFVLLFPMWLLHLVPNEMENPFVPDYNGLNTKELQEELNKVLAALLSDSFSHCPELRVLAADAGERLGWNELLSLSEQETPMPQRYSFSAVFHKRISSQSSSIMSSLWSKTASSVSVSITSPRAVSTVDEVDEDRHNSRTLLPEGLSPEVLPPEERDPPSGFTIREVASDCHLWSPVQSPKKDPGCQHVAEDAEGVASCACERGGVLLSSPPTLPVTPRSQTPGCPVLARSRQADLTGDRSPTASRPGQSAV